jgi:two-component system OmpR family sensor kinase
MSRQHHPIEVEPLGRIGISDRIRRRLGLPQSLRFQLLSRSLFVLAGLLLLIGLFQYVFMQQFIYKNKADSIRTQMMSVPRDAWQQLADGGSGDGNGNANGGPAGRRPMFFIPDSTLSLINANGSVTVISTGHDADMPPMLEQQQYQEALQSGPGDDADYRIVKDGHGNEQMLVLQKVENRGNVLGLIQVSTSTGPLKVVLFQQLLTFLALSILALIAGILAFLPVLKRTLVPLSNMVDTVERIDSGNLAERFPAHQGQEEVDHLAVSFNRMLERLEASFEAEKEAKEQMRRFIADASHELRTPLTSIHGFLEVLLRGAMKQPEQLHRALTSMYGESERINKLVQDLLLLAKLDRAPAMVLAEGDLSDVIRGMEPQLKVLAGHRKVELLLETAVCPFDKDKMKQVILNLYHNAVQHTDPERGIIAITTQDTGGGCVELAVRDNGPGIGKEHLPHLFDRFYRSDSSRTRKYGGAGLGLSITKSIVEAHGGTIRAESVEGAGSTFTVRLPKERVLDEHPVVEYP